MLTQQSGKHSYPNASATHYVMLALYGWCRSFCFATCDDLSCACSHTTVIKHIHIGTHAPLILSCSHLMGGVVVVSATSDYLRMHHAVVHVFCSCLHLMGGVVVFFDLRHVMICLAHAHTQSAKAFIPGRVRDSFFHVCT